MALSEGGVSMNTPVTPQADDRMAETRRQAGRKAWRTYLLRASAVGYYKRRRRKPR